MAGLECKIWPAPALSDSNLCVEKKLSRLDSGYVHCTVTLQDKSGAFRSVKEPKVEMSFQMYL